MFYYYYSCNNFFQPVLQNVNKAQLKIRTRKDNVAGVNLPVFESYQDGSDSYELAGLARGGQQMAIVKKNYQKAVELLVELASLQTSFITLDEVIKITNRRVNAIGIFKAISILGRLNQTVNLTINLINYNVQFQSML